MIRQDCLGEWPTFEKRGVVGNPRLDLGRTRVKIPVGVARKCQEMSCRLTVIPLSGHPDH